MIRARVMQKAILCWRLTDRGDGVGASGKEGSAHPLLPSDEWQAADSHDGLRCWGWFQIARMAAEEHQLADSQRHLHPSSSPTMTTQMYIQRIAKVTVLQCRIYMKTCTWFTDPTWALYAMVRYYNNAKSDHFQVPENGTSSGRIQKWWSLFHGNTPRPQNGGRGICFMCLALLDEK